MLRTIFASKITKNGFVTHHCAQLFAKLACYAQDFFPIRAGAPQQRCATKTNSINPRFLTYKKKKEKIVPASLGNTVGPPPAAQAIS